MAGKLRRIGLGFLALLLLFPFSILALEGFEEGFWGLWNPTGIADGSPGGMVEIDDPIVGKFSIDRFEYPNIKGAKPQSFAGLDAAVKACDAQGKRLCTAAEWRRACLGPDGKNTYAYGPDYNRARCHINGELPSGYTSTQASAPYLSPAGRHHRCQSAEGVFDLIGNVEEWVLDDWQGLEGMLEGGAWYTMEAYADCTGRYSRQPDYRVDPKQPVFSAGFRCCQSEDFLTWDAIELDRKSRLKGAYDGKNPPAYAPQAEVEIEGRYFIDQYEYPNQAGALPLVGATWQEAGELCAAENKRLCTADEWQRACSGPEHLTYPHGDFHLPYKCPILLDAQPKSGDFEGCVSADGVHDMVGSLWEWTSSPLPLKERARNPGEVLMEVRGGSWTVDPLKSRCIPAEGYPAAPIDARYESMGFRCCRDKGEVGQAGSTPALKNQGAKGQSTAKTDGQSTPKPTNQSTAKTTGQSTAKTAGQSTPKKCPPGMVYGAGFCMDIYEYPNRQGQRPQGNLTFDEAKTRCAGRGLRLCTSAEWTTRCSSAGENRWPYGNAYVPDRCQFGISAQDKKIGQSLPSGSKSACKTPDGLFDLSGNLWEWTAGPLGQAYLQGGGWNANSGLGQCAFKAPADADHRAPEVGMRCCADAF